MQIRCYCCCFQAVQHSIRLLQYSSFTSYAFLSAPKIVNIFFHYKYISTIDYKINNKKLAINFSSPLHCKVYTKRHKTCKCIVSKVLSTVTKLFSVVIK